MLRLLFSEEPVWDLRRWVSAGSTVRWSPASGEATGRGRRKGRERMLVNGAVITGKGAAKGRSPEEIQQIRTILQGRFDDLNTEYEVAVAENHKLRLVEIGDAAGD